MPFGGDMEEKEGNQAVWNEARMHALLSAKILGELNIWDGVQLLLA